MFTEVYLNLQVGYVDASVAACGEHRISNPDRLALFWLMTLAPLLPENYFHLCLLRYLIQC